jgi:hypothetical protein
MPSAINGPFAAFWRATVAICLMSKTLPHFRLRTGHAGTMAGIAQDAA